jgi:hypothetical protein
MADTIRTCWAISAALKARCDMPAGHTGEHSITVSWSDDQCWSPEFDEPVALTVVQPVPEVVQEVVEEQTEACIACSHMHKAGSCKCGCYEHI